MWLQCLVVCCPLRIHSLCTAIPSTVTVICDGSSLTSVQALSLPAVVVCWRAIEPAVPARPGSRVSRCSRPSPALTTTTQRLAPLWWRLYSTRLCSCRLFRGCVSTAAWLSWRRGCQSSGLLQVDVDVSTSNILLPEPSWPSAILSHVMLEPIAVWPSTLKLTTHRRRQWCYDCTT